MICNNTSFFLLEYLILLLTSGPNAPHLFNYVDVSINLSPEQVHLQNYSSWILEIQVKMGIILDAREFLDGGPALSRRQADARLHRPLSSLYHQWVNTAATWNARNRALPLVMVFFPLRDSDLVLTFYLPPENPADQPLTSVSAFGRNSSTLFLLSPEAKVSVLLGNNTPQGPELRTTSGERVK